MVKLLLATKNDGKRREIERLLEGLEIEVMLLGDVPDVEEDGTTFINRTENN